MTDIQFMKISRTEGKWYFIVYRVANEKVVKSTIIVKWLVSYCRFKMGRVDVKVFIVLGIFLGFFSVFFKSSTGRIAVFLRAKDYGWLEPHISKLIIAKEKKN